MSIKIDHKKIREIAFDKGISVSKIADETNISRAQVYNIFNGTYETVFDRTAFSLAKALHCNPKDLSE